MLEELAELEEDAVWRSEQTETMERWSQSRQGKSMQKHQPEASIWKDLPTGCMHE